MRIPFPLVLALSVLVPFGAVPAEETPQLPERFTANLTVMGAGRASGMSRIAITVERWSTDAEREALFAALEEGGSTGLVEAMQEMDVGRLQVDNSLGWRLRAASTWQTDEGRIVRVVTDRPIFFGERIRGTRSEDYPVGVIELRLGDGGKGEGALLAAAQVRFDDQGRIEVRSLPQNTGPQKLTAVRAVPPKSKKKARH